MIAEPGRRYAQVIGARVHWTFTIAELPEWNENAFLTVDITDQPQVQIGWTHEGGDVFSAPPPPTPEELARAARRAAWSTEAAADAFIDSLRDVTPAEIKAFVQNNVTDLASARTFISKLACAIAYALSGGRDK